MLATPQVTANTREAICKLLAWDFKQLKLGVWDVVDSSGKFHPTDSTREKNAGHDMPLKAAPGPSDIDKTCWFRFDFFLWFQPVFHFLQSLCAWGMENTFPRHFAIGKVTWRPTILLIA